MKNYFNKCMASKRIRSWTQKIYNFFYNKKRRDDTQLRKKNWIAFKPKGKCTPDLFST